MTLYHFVEWRDETGAVIGTTPAITIAIATDKTLTAYYAETTPPPPITHSLILTSGAGGTTNPVPGTYTLEQGATQQVTAVPSSGYIFSNWLLDGSNAGSANPYAVTMNADHTLQAVFAQTFTLNISATTGGTTNPVPSTYTIVSGQTVQVTAIPSSGYSFHHWILNGTTYTSNPISVLMSQNQDLTAYFSEIPPPPPTTYNITVASTAYGTTDPTSGIYTHNAGTTAIITAFPQAGYHFDHWELDGIVRTENPISILMDKDHTLLAVFSEVPPKPPPSLAGWSILSIIVVGTVIGYLVLKKK